jgi:nucleoside-diphosphate-sugar epimerase
MRGATLFVTGGTGHVGRFALPRLLADARIRRVYALARDPARLQALAACWPRGAELVPVAGDICRPGLGIDSTERRMLSGEVSAVLHLAADTTFSRSLDEARRTNLHGTRHLLDLVAGWPRLERLAYASTAFVAGRRTGVVPEGACEPGHGWVNGYEQSKAEAEACVRQSPLDWVILRPSAIVCDDEDGAVSQPNAVHRALRLYHGGLAAMMPSAPGSALDVVPAGYVGGAVAELALRPDVGGETLHLCAGRGTLPLDEMLDLAYEAWSADPHWRRKGIGRPVLTDAETYALFERTVEETGDARLRQVVRSLSHFIPQLALPKRFDTARADRALGRPAPAVHGYWRRMVEGLVRDGWRGGSAAA